MVDKKHTMEGIITAPRRCKKSDKSRLIMVLMVMASTRGTVFSLFLPLYFSSERHENFPLLKNYLIHVTEVKTIQVNIILTSVLL